MSSATNPPSPTPDLTNLGRGESRLSRILATPHLRYVFLHQPPSNLAGIRVAVVSGEQGASGGCGKVIGTPAPAPCRPRPWLLIPASELGEFYPLYCEKLINFE